MNTKHTQGPWKVVEMYELPEDYYLEDLVCSDDGTPIATVISVPGKRDHQQTRANAALIAQSTEILSALIKTQSMLAECLRTGVSSKLATEASIISSDARIIINSLSYYCESEVERIEREALNIDRFGNRLKDEN